MKIAIMQPYFFPYIGYFQLIAAVDTFVVYDNIKYTKKGWINRNRLLLNGQAVTFSLPLGKASDSFDICQRELAESFNRKKLLNQFKGAYHNAPNYSQGMEIIGNILDFQDCNLFRFLMHSIEVTSRYLGLATEIRISSDLGIDHSLKGEKKIFAICDELGAKVYVNAIGGRELYSSESFTKEGINLRFVHTNSISYDQFGHEFVPWLSIIDLLMFNPLDEVKNWVENAYKLID